MNIILFLILMVSCTKPIPRLVEERDIISENDNFWLYERLGNENVLELSLDESIEFAINYNLSLRVQEAELRVIGDAIGREMILMLPSLEVNGLVAHRSNLPASFSQLVEPRIVEPLASFSSLQTDSFWNFELSWNILNTGIQYFRVKEAKNATLAKEFIYQRAIQDLIRDVVSNYWLVAVMQESSRKVDELTEISRDLAKKLRSKVDEGYISLQEATDLIGKIYYQQVQAKLFLQSYRGAIDRFKSLLGIPPCIEVVLSVPKQKILPAPLPPPCELHQIALNYRPELYQTDVELAIHEDEVKEALLTLFPALIPFLSYTADSNPFLIHNYWTTVGFRVLYNLLSIPLSLNAQLTAEDQIRVSKAQRLFLSLSILSQIHLVYAQYLDALDRYKDAQIYWEAKKNSYDLALAKKNLAAIGDLEYVFPLSDLAYAETQMNLFYVEVMSLLEQLSNTIGLPRYFTEQYGQEQCICEEELQ